MLANMPTMWGSWQGATRLEHQRERGDCLTQALE